MTLPEKNSPAVKHRFHFLERNYDPSPCRVNEGAMDDYESDLRLFALRRAAEEIGSGHNSGNDNSSHRVVVSVQAAPDRGCPMHGRHGSFQLPTSSSLQHQQHQHSYSHERPSRKEMARELRLSVAREEAAAKAAAAANRSSSYSVERTLSMSGNRGAAVRSYSLEYNNGYNSMPRNSSSNKRSSNNSSSNVDRRGSFGGSSVTVNSSSSGGGGGKPVPRDIFRGKLDFKNILRRFDPKEEERSHSARNSVGRSLSGAGGGRYNQDNYGGGGYEEYSYGGGVTSPPRSRRGSIVDSDFDFRGGASREPVWDNPGRFRYGGGGGSAANSAANSRPTSPRPQSQPPPQQQMQPSPTRVLKIDVESGNDSEAVAAAAGVTSNPVSPRRVGFGEQTVFDFDPRRVRSAVSSPVPPANPPQTAKPILRHTSSIEQQQQQQQQSLSLMDQYERSLPEKKEEKTEDNGDSLVQIYKPPRDSNTEEEEEEEDDSDDTLGGGEEDEGKSSPNRKGASARPVPPPLGECWSRSQSFPPPRTSHENEVLDASAALRKQSLQEEDAAAATAASSSTAQTRGKRKGRSIGEAITLSALLPGKGAINFAAPRPCAAG